MWNPQNATRARFLVLYRNARISKDITTATVAGRLISARPGDAWCADRPQSRSGLWLLDEAARERRHGAYRYARHQLAVAAGFYAPLPLP